MRSLAAKLTLAFLVVGLIGATMVAILVQRYTRREFDRLVLDQNQQALVEALTSYYAANGSWSGVEQVFRPGPHPPQQIPGPRWETRRALFTIANADGQVVFGGDPQFQNSALTSRDLRQGIPLTVNGENVGWLLFNPALLDRWEANTPEGLFLAGVNRVIFLSALIAGGIALLLGGVLAFSMTRSLRELTAATSVLAGGNLGHQVKVRSKDEIGELAESFNQMSAELAQSNELRRKMTADIAHDLRTPVSVILGYTEALSDEKLQASPEIYDVMHTEARHLTRLIEDLKVLSSADAGELPLVFQTISPGRLLRRAADAHRVRAEAKDIRLEVDAAENLPDIEVDVERMAQVLGNLMSNALRYTPEGGKVELSAGIVSGQVRLDVADTGPGIDAEDLPNIFARSYRGDQARRQESGETGLGLAIARSLVEAQGGTISVKSEKGAGTRFTILLPAHT